MSVGVHNGVHRPAELGPVPPVGEQIDVLAHPLDKSVCLQCVPAGEGEAVLAEYAQGQPDQTVL